jgi:hypothetical protein
VITAVCHLTHKEYARDQPISSALLGFRRKKWLASSQKFVSLLSKISSLG